MCSHGLYILHLIIRQVYAINKNELGKKVKRSCGFTMLTNVSEKMGTLISGMGYLK